MLRSALASAREAGHLLRFAPPPPKAPGIARLLAERYGENAGARKSVTALQALLRRLRLAQYEWDKVAPADRADVGWVLWEGAPPPAEHEAFLRGYLQWVETPRRRLPAMRLAAAWTAAFDPARPSIRVVGDWLLRHAAWLADPWPRLAAEFKLFSVESGPAALAEAFLAGREPAARFFDDLRLPGGSAASGFALAMLAAAAANVEPRLAWEPRLAARLCDLALGGVAFRTGTALRRASRRTEAVRLAVAEALLLGWERQAPPPEVKVQIAAFLNRHYGDARLVREGWRDMRAPAAAIMSRWLTEATVEIYFRLARRTNTVDQAQLAERETFWMTGLDQVDDAWLLASPRNVARLGADRPAHGVLSGCRPDQSALLLRIDGMTILEMSHAASESVWLAGNPLAPPLYRGAAQPYWPAALAGGADFSSAYSRTGNDTWQERLARFIDRRCGRKMAV